MVDPTTSRIAQVDTSAEPVEPNVERRRWIVGVDGSDGAHHAACWAAMASRRADGSIRCGRVDLVATISEPAIVTGDPTWLAAVPRVEAAVEREADRVADDVRMSTGDSGPVVETLVRHGVPAQVLLDESKRSELLVVGARGRGGFTRLLLGSTSTQCATHATTPTVVVPDKAPIAEARRIMVAMDGSENSLAALRWALDFADDTSVVECVTVWDVAPIAVGADQFFFPEAGDLARGRFDELVDQEIAAIGEHGATIERTFVEGRARAALAERAEQADLLVMGARGCGAVTAALLGSVSSWLLHHVDRPMVVVPHR